MATEPAVPPTKDQAQAEASQILDLLGGLLGATLPPAVRALARPIAEAILIEVLTNPSVQDRLDKARKAYEAFGVIAAIFNR